MGTPTNLLLQHHHSELVASHSGTVNIHDQRDKQHTEGCCRLELRLMALESEQKKIDAFKRELPWCMQLLHEAIEASKEQLAFHRFSCHEQLKRPVSCSFDNRTSEFQSVTNRYEQMAREKSPNYAYANSNEGEQSGKRLCTRGLVDNAFHWINVWNPKAEVSSGIQAGFQSFDSSEERLWCYMHEHTLSSSAFGSKQKLGGAFAPFSRNSRLVQPTPRLGAINPADLVLKCPDSVITAPQSRQSAEEKAESSAALESSICTKLGNSPQEMEGTVLKERKSESDASNEIPLTRKPRRSWSIELHQLFVDSLQKLGGAQATPKQIRELMKVDGLTNDEVKSHLQKYRLHAKRLSLSPTSSSQAFGVMLGERAWAPTEYAPHSYNTTLRQSRACGTSVTQESVAERHCSGELHSQASSCCGKQLLPPGNLQQGPVQLVGYASAGCLRLSDVDGEESVGEAVKPDNSGSKSHHHSPGLQLHDKDEIGNHSSNDNQAYNSFGEDDKDYEDSLNGL